MGSGSVTSRAAPAIQPAVHFDFTGGGEDLGALQVSTFQQLWNAFNPQDKIAVDGIWGPNTAARVEQSPAQGLGNPPVLRKGQFSREVGNLQIMLRQALGWSSAQLAADMHFGSATFKAAVEFQNQHGLVADGIAGPKTIAKLEAVTGEKLLAED
jgi:murein L,D-transpeptidase YcbB/YkuD